MTTTTTTSSSSSLASNPLENLGLPSPLLLGSASFTRKLILKEMGIPFHILVRPIDEKGLGDREKDTPEHLVSTLAKAKMDHLVQQIMDGKCQDEMPKRSSSSSNYSSNKDSWIVLTGDQVVTCNGSILEKAESEEEAQDFVAQYGNNPPSTVGAVVMTHLPSQIQVSGLHIATINFKPEISQDAKQLLQDMIADGAPVLSCAGGLMIEHPFVKKYIERIDGTEDSVMGLSKDTVLELLKQLKEECIQAGVKL